jgi:hypothetical protein
MEEKVMVVVGGEEEEKVVVVVVVVVQAAVQVPVLEVGRLPACRSPQLPTTMVPLAALVVAWPSASLASAAGPGLCP